MSSLKDRLENMTYENKKMGDFLELIGLSVDDITDIVIHGEAINMELCKKIKNKIPVLEKKIVKEEIKKLDIKIQRKENAN